MDLVLAAVGLLAVLHVLYSLWTAKRLDRLHARVDAATAALDGQLRQRAAAALTFAQTGRGAGARELADAAQAALAATGLGHDREAVESALSRAIHAVPDGEGTLVDETTRTAFARSFHNNAVADALTVRRRRIVRWFHLAGSARLPSFFEMDDSAPQRRTIEV